LFFSSPLIALRLAAAAFARLRVEFVQLLAEFGLVNGLLRRIGGVVCEYPVETAFE
jgi:hypothetical protein